MWTAGFLHTKGAFVLRENINNAVKEAMKARDERLVGTLRMMNAAIKNADIEARGGGKGLLADEDILGLLQKLIKQRQESVELYVKGGRQELADQESSEIEIILGFLPKQLSEAEAKEAVAGVTTCESDFSGFDVGGCGDYVVVS